MSPTNTAVYREIRYRNSGGLTLAARDYGPANDRLPVVCLPGLSRTVRDFHRLAVYLSREHSPARRVICFDYRGRGDSDRDPDWRNYNARTEAEDVLEGMAQLGIDRAGFVGTSRGGIVTMLAATIRKDAIAAAVFNDVGPIIESPGLARIKDVLARADDPTDWGDAALRLKQAYGRDFPVLSESDWAEYARAIYRDVDGQPRSDYDRALLNTLASVAADRPLPPLWSAFGALAGLPLLAIRGERSDLLSAGTLEEMRLAHPGMEHIVVPGQGHPPLLTAVPLMAAIGDFLDRSA